MCTRQTRALGALRTLPVALDSRNLRLAVHELSKTDPKNISDPEIYASLLRSCGKIKDLERGRLVHTHIRHSEHSRLTYLGNLLIEMYGKCGRLEDAQSTFESLHETNNFSWNILISAYTHNGQLQEARDFFERMTYKTVISSNVLIAAYARSGDLHEAQKIFDGLPEVNTVSWNSMITAYAQNGHLDEARRLFERMVEKDVVSWTAMVAAYGQSADTYQAKQMFDTMPERNVVTWNAMISAFAQCGEMQQARVYFERMPLRDLVSWTSMVVSYTQSGDLDQAREVFESMPERDEASWNSLISANALRGDLQEACEVFERMPNKDSVSWNVMLSAHNEKDEIQKVVYIFNKMPHRDKVSWTAMLGAYAQRGHIQNAKEVFDMSPERDSVSWRRMLTGYTQEGYIEEARRLFDTMPERNLAAWNILMVAYAQNGRVSLAEKIFNEMPEHDIVSWNSMMGAYTQNDRHREAVKLFVNMDLMGVQVDGISFITVIDSCTNSLSIRDGMVIHECAVEKGMHLQVPVSNALINMHGKLGNVWFAKHVFDEMPQRDVISSNAIVSAFSQNGHLQEAREIFDGMKAHDTVSWNNMIAGYSQNGFPQESLKLFKLMDLSGTPANHVSFIVAVDACTGLASLQQGRVIHWTLVSSSIAVDNVLGSALINMYGKCGSMRDARLVFDGSMSREASAWNAMLAAYAQYGHGAEALELYRQMQLYGASPDEITHVIVLSVCAHAGLVRKCREFFWCVTEDYDSDVIVDYYICMVDALARSGQVERARDLLENMPFHPNAAAWMSVLGSCKVHGDGVGGSLAAQVASSLEPQDSSAYVVLSNMYKVEQRGRATSTPAWQVAGVHKHIGQPSGAQSVEMIVRSGNYSGVCRVLARQNSRVAQKNSEISGKPLEKGQDGANVATGAPKTSETAPGDGIGEEMRADTFVVEDTEVKKNHNSGSGWMGAIKGVVEKVKEVTGVSKPDERLPK